MVKYKPLVDDADVDRIADLEPERGEIVRITYKKHDYVYRVDKSKIFKNFYTITVVGGPYRYRALTTCKKKSIKKNLKLMIESLTHK